MNTEPYGTLGLRFTQWDKERHTQYFVVSATGNRCYKLTLNQTERDTIRAYPAYLWLVIGTRNNPTLILDDLLGLCHTRAKALNMAKLLALDLALA